MAYNILEIGPGDQPRHDVGKFNLKEGETYTAMDVEPHVFELPVWGELRKNFGDRIKQVIGSRDDIPTEIKENSYDEVLMLGSQGDAEKNLREIDKILKVGGILKLGILKSGGEDLLKEWGAILKRQGV